MRLDVDVGGARDVRHLVVVAVAVAVAVGLVVTFPVVIHQQDLGPCIPKRTATHQMQMQMQM